MHHSRFYSRREALAAGAAFAFTPWLAGQVDGAVRHRPKFQGNPFTLGIASGEPAPDGFVIWTRLAVDPLEGGGMPAELIEVGWEVAADEQFSQVVRRGKVIATPQLAHAVHVEITGLEPDRPYWYRFHAGSETSPVGRGRTFPKRFSEPKQLRFAFASCQHYESGLFTAYEHMAREDLDLVIHLGDYIYDGAGRDGRVRKHVGKEVMELADYRNRYAQYKTDSHLQATHAAFPWLVTWDDHEFDNNCAGDVSEEKDVDRASFLRRRANAYQAYYEHMPLRRTSVPRGPDMRIYRRVPFGRLADFFVLDTRQYRTDQPNGDRLKPLTGDALSPDAAMLGRKQEHWLTAGLLRSVSDWNVLAQQVMMARVDRVPGEEDAFSMDQWAGYDVPRRRLMSFLSERTIPNPVVLTGDIHSNWVNDLKIDYDRPDAPTVATEFVGTSISSGGNGSQKTKATDGILAENPFVRFYNAERGYVRCTITPERWRSDYQVVEAIDKPGAPLITRASFEVENGQPGAQQV